MQAELIPTPGIIENNEKYCIANIPLKAESHSLLILKLIGLKKPAWPKENLKAQSKEWMKDQYKLIPL